MTEPIKTAPRDGTEIVVTMAGGKTFPVKWEDGFVDGTYKPCGCWVATTDNFPPCWTDGVCWSSNAEEQVSDQPVRWRHK